MDTAIIFALIVVVLVVVVISAGVKVVPQSETRVIERFGRFQSVLPPGLNFIIPFIDKPKLIYIRTKRGYIATKIIDLREQVYEWLLYTSPSPRES